MGHSRRFDAAPKASDLPPTADITGQGHHFQKVPMDETARAVERGG
jgi:hypothetical protein